MTNLPATPEELGQLAQEGAIALVGAMATNAFEAARTGIARLFRRLGPDQERAAQTQLDSDQDLVADTEDAERDDVRGELALGWRRRLARLLKEHPDAELELQDVLADLLTTLPDAQRQWVQNNTVSAPGSAVYGAMFGNVIHYDLAGKQTPPAPGGGDGR